MDGRSPLFYLTFQSHDGALVGAAIVDAFDPFQARMRANAEGLNPGGALCTLDRLDPQGVPPEMIGRMLSPAEAYGLIELLERADPIPKHPPVPSVRRAKVRHAPGRAR